MENQLIEASQYVTPSLDYILLAYGATAIILGWMGLVTLKMLKRSKLKLKKAESSKSL